MTHPLIEGLKTIGAYIGEKTGFRSIDGQTVWRYMHHRNDNKRLPYRKLDGRVGVDPIVLDAWIASNLQDLI